MALPGRMSNGPKCAPANTLAMLRESEGTPTPQSGKRGTPTPGPKSPGAHSGLHAHTLPPVAFCFSNFCNFWASWFGGLEMAKAVLVEANFDA